MTRVANEENILMYTISKITAREIIDCRGWPTVQADVWVNGQLKGRADVPACRKNPDDVFSGKSHHF